MVFDTLSTTPHFFDLLIYDNYKKHIDDATLRLVKRLNDKQCFEVIRFIKTLEKEVIN